MDASHNGIPPVKRLYRCSQIEVLQIFVSPEARGQYVGELVFSEIHVLQHGKIEAAVVRQRP
jgi:hypothetical protein